VVATLVLWVRASGPLPQPPSIGSAPPPSAPALVWRAICHHRSPSAALLPQLARPHRRPMVIPRLCPTVPTLRRSMAPHPCPLTVHRHRPTVPYRCRCLPGWRRLTMRHLRSPMVCRLRSPTSSLQDCTTGTRLHNPTVPWLPLPMMPTRRRHMTASRPSRQPLPMPRLWRRSDDGLLRATAVGSC
jgi:hypothetical protein